MTTKELLDYIINRSPQVVEAEIHHSGLRATHWFVYNNLRIYHEGISGGMMQRTSKRAILAGYPKTNWTIAK